MSENADYSPTTWGDKFSSAYAHYDQHAGRSYTAAVTDGKTSYDLLPQKIVTRSLRPLVIVTDETGSMSNWPATIFSKLPYLDNEARTVYLGEDYEIVFAAIGDAHNREDYPLQMRPPVRGAAMKNTLEELVTEGKGGGGGHETYELAALYLLYNLEVIPGGKPIVIFIGDEMPYENISASMAQTHARVGIPQSESTRDIFEQLKEKCSVYFIQKPYGDSKFSDDMSVKVRRVWNGLLSEDHIAPLSDASRVVDVIFGILARETDQVGYFREEIEGRQNRRQVDTVYRSLGTIHSGVLNEPAKKLMPGASKLHTPLGGKAGNKLLPPKK